MQLQIDTLKPKIILRVSDLKDIEYKNHSGWFMQISSQTRVHERYNNYMHIIMSNWQYTCQSK